MSEIVTLRHPKLPASQVLRIDRRRIAAHLAAGWEEATADQPGTAKPATGQADTGGTPAPEQAAPPSEPTPKRPGRKTPDTTSEEQ